MGTGAGGLTYEESLMVTLKGLRDSHVVPFISGDLAFKGGPEQILLAAPSDMSPIEINRLSMLFEDSMEHTTTPTSDVKRQKEPNVPPGSSPSAADLAPFYPDHPAHEDSLGRAAVAEALTTIIRAVFDEAKLETSTPNTDRDRTFMVHIHGKWGSGKTSILNFLKQELQSGEATKRWVVIDYNAWRNQKNGPAWWTLLAEVYRQSVGQLEGWSPSIARRLRKSERIWRFKSGWAPYIIGFAGLLWLATVIAALSGAGFKDTLTLLAAVFTVWGGFSAFGRTTRLGSSRTASTFLELSRDPLRPLTRRYEELVNEIGHPVAVFVDDLDRCDSDFVVELIQTIQTLFRKAPVAYVVAADRNWICTSYEKAYGDFTSSIKEPGRPLGHLFLEKIFQLSISVPALPKSLQATYWDRLLLGRRPRKINIEKLRASQREKIAKLQSDTDVRAHLAAIGNPAERRVAGTVAFQRLQDQDLRTKRQHFLQNYAALLEPNPRAMKRLLNAYGFKLGFQMMADVSSLPDSLVRWTLLELRWPLLAEHLIKHPEQIESVGSRFTPANVDSELDELFGSDAVGLVAEGLDPDTVRILTAGETDELSAQAAVA